MKRIQIDIAYLRQLIEVDKLTQVRVAQILGVNRATVERACKLHGLLTQRTGPRSGREHTGWKGGKILLGGYYYIYSPDHPNATKQKRVAEHRLVMESKLGRYLLRTEVVHHRNGVPTDNRPENLEVFQSNAEHLKHELVDRVPNWTPEGYARMKGPKKRTTTRRHSESCDSPRTQSSDQKQDISHKSVLPVS
jgi:predicted transcriptional regulator